MLGSVFYGNVAGGENIENGESMGEGEMSRGKYSDGGWRDGVHDGTGGAMLPPSPTHEDIKYFTRHMTSKNNFAQPDQHVWMPLY